MSFLKKNWGNLLILAFIALLFIPQTGLPIKVFVNRLIAFSPSEIKAEKRETIAGYGWHLTSLENETVNFSQSEGRVAVINFWATWCAPCVAEMPAFQALYDAYGDKVDFYFVSTEKRETLEKFLQKKELALPVYMQTTKAPEGMRTLSLPTTYVLSKEGSIVMKKTGAANWNGDKVHRTLDALLLE